ncbi:MAG: hypothetical protein MJ252_17020 [archaeon]|nr:hypothetical protein [archaeon]
MFYLDEHKDIKKKIKAKAKKIQQEDEEEEEKEEKPKKRKKSESSPEKMLNKKTKRKNTEEDEEEEEKPKKRRKSSVASNSVNKRKKSTASIKSESEKKKKKTKEEDIDLDALQFAPRPKGDTNNERRPFQRIDNSLKDKLPASLKDNSYEFFMRKTGDNFGQLANDKLKITRGKDFKKEKTKFKNKSSAGGFTISQTIRAIKLDDDSD